VIGQCCNFHGINSTVEISWDIFRILADYRLRHLVNNMAIYIYPTHDYIRMEITVLYLKILQHQLSITWSQISVYWLCSRVASKLDLRPSNLQLLPWNFQIQYSYLLINRKLTEFENSIFHLFFYFWIILSFAGLTKTLSCSSTLNIL